MPAFNIAAALRPRHGVFCALASVSLFSSSFANANTAPRIGGAPVTSVTAAHYYSFQPWASDPDRDKLTFSVRNKPSWASFDSTTGRLYGTPIPPANVGTATGIVISVSDGTSRTSLPAFSIKVLPLPNNPPTISGAPAGSVAPGQAYSFQPTAKDPNGLRVTFGIWNKPAWASFDSATGRLSGTPGTSSVGTYSNILITAYDGYSKATLPVFSVTVQTPAGPVSTGSATVDWIPPTQNTDGTTLTDLAGYHLFYGTTAANLDHSVNIANPGLASYVISNLSPATWYFAMTAYNKGGAESDRSDVASIVTH
jgi:hypothetical protein